VTETPIINGVQPPFLPIGGVDALREKTLHEINEGESRSFQSILQKELRAVKFSAHAQERLKSRNVEFSEQEMNKLERAVSRAEEKGSRDSLVMMDKVALIVNIKNRTVVTALDNQSMREHVFTNIDAAIIA